MKENQYLIDYYNSYDESGRLESKHGMVRAAVWNTSP